MTAIVQWVRQQPAFNTNSHEYYPSIGVDSSGNTYTAYYTNGTVMGQTNVKLEDIAVVKLDPDGNVLWVREQPSFNTDSSDMYPSIAVDDTGCYVTYYTKGTASGQQSSGGQDIVVFKLNTVGTTQWVKQYPTHNTESHDINPAIDVDILGNTYIAYNTNGVASGEIDNGGNDIVVFKLNPTGSVLWVRQQPSFNTNSQDIYPEIAVDISGNSYVCYQTTGTASEQQQFGSEDVVVFKLNTLGETQWVVQEPTFNTDYNDLRPVIGVDYYGNSYVAFYTNNGVVSGQTSIGSQDIVVFKLDTMGKLVWSRQEPAFNTTIKDNSPSIAVDDYGNVCVAYNTQGVVPGGTMSGATDVVVMKFNTDGDLLVITQQPTFNAPLACNSSPSVVVYGDCCYVAYYTYNSVVSGQIFSGGHDIVIFKLCPFICVAPNTQITMMDDTVKPIQDIVRGDIVRGGHRVARVCQDPIDRLATLSMAVIKPNTFGVGCPNQPLIISYNHPIIYQGARRPIQCFANWKGIETHKQLYESLLKDYHVLTDDLDDKLYLYDLQFDHEGTYWANGVEIQSRSPYSVLTPLPRKMYFNSALYSEERVWDSLDHPIPLIDEKLNLLDNF